MSVFKLDYRVETEGPHKNGHFRFPEQGRILIYYDGLFYPITRQSDLYQFIINNALQALIPKYDGQKFPINVYIDGEMLKHGIINWDVSLEALERRSKVKQKNLLEKRQTYLRLLNFGIF